MLYLCAYVSADMTHAEHGLMV